jgi:hypothetical protein
LISALLGGWWIHVTGVWGGGRNCEGPPGKGVCVTYPPSWGWLVFGIVLGAVFGCLLAAATMSIFRRAGRNVERHP